MSSYQRIAGTINPAYVAADASGNVSVAGVLVGSGDLQLLTTKRLRFFTGATDIASLTGGSTIAGNGVLIYDDVNARAGSIQSWTNIVSNTNGVVLLTMNSATQCALIKSDGSTPQGLACGPVQVANAASLRSGTVTPSGAVTGVAGDIYLWSGGASGARLWVCGGGTVWAAVAGV